MVFSKFNHITKIPNTDQFLLFNFLTGGLLELDSPTYKRITDLEGLSNQEIEILTENGFIVNHLDEIDYLRFGNKLVCADEELLSVLIAPTLACNFNCPYCFEHHGKERMTTEVQNEIIKFIENSLKTKRHKHLFVYWFGGEPLLCTDIILSMSKQIIDLVEKYNVSYSSAMSTNGYYLTEEVLKTLEQCRLSRIQITIDGLKEIHDKTRFLVNGEGTFDVIVSNLYKLHTNITIQIRSNLSKNNIDEFQKLNLLIQDIKRKTSSDISLYGAHMSTYEFNNENVDALELSMKEYSDILKNNKLLGSTRMNQSKFAFCDAAKVYSFCFDEKGNMYKCWNDIGSTEFSYDNVFSANQKGVNFVNKNALEYLAHSFPEECISCKVLPLCFGGCIKKRVVEKKKTCSPIKYNIDDYIIKKYNMAQGGDYNESGN